MKNKLIFCSLILLTLLLGSSAGFVDATSRSKSKDAQIKASLGQLRNVAEMIYDSNYERTDLEGYEGLCEAGGLNVDYTEYSVELKRLSEEIRKNNNDTPVVCYSSEGEYCLQAFLKTTGGGWCIDSTGNMNAEDYCDSVNYDCAYNKGEETTLHDTFQVLYEEERITAQKEKRNNEILQIIAIIFVFAAIISIGILIAKGKILRSQTWRLAWGKLFLAVVFIIISLFVYQNGFFLEEFFGNNIFAYLFGMLIFLFFIPWISLELAFSWLGAITALLIIVIYYYCLACIVIDIYKTIKRMIKGKS